MGWMRSRAGWRPTTRSCTQHSCARTLRYTSIVVTPRARRCGKCAASIPPGTAREYDSFSKIRVSGIFVVSVSNPSLRAMTSSPADPQGDVVVNVFGRTDVGRTREHNEDAFVVADLTTGNATLQPEVRQHVLGPKGTLFMVADGMGGAAAGEVRRAVAVG